MLGRHFSESCYSEYNAWPPATHSISSEERSSLPTSVRVSRRLQKVLEPLARAMDRPAAESKREGRGGVHGKPLTARKTSITEAPL